MTRSALIRAGALALAGLAASTIAAAAPAYACDEDDGRRPTTATTRVTFTAPDCNGCTLSLIHARPDGEVWQSRQKTVSDGSVTFRIRRDRTRGMSVAIRAPWEGATGYVTLVAFKYAGQPPGDRVTLAEARGARKASGCWAGTSADEATIRLSTRRVTVAAHDGPRTPAALVYSTITQDAMVPMQRTFHGILGSQDVNFCGRG